MNDLIKRTTSPAPRRGGEEVRGAGVPVALFYMAFKVGSWPFLLAATILGALAIFCCNSHSGFRSNNG